MLKQDILAVVKGGVSERSLSAMACRGDSCHFAVRMMRDDAIVIRSSSLMGRGDDGGGETGERAMLGHGHDLGKGGFSQRPAGPQTQQAQTRKCRWRSAANRGPAALCRVAPDRTSSAPTRPY